VDTLHALDASAKELPAQKHTAIDNMGELLKMGVVDTLVLGSPGK
jgi:hypothetical protein